MFVGSKVLYINRIYESQNTTPLTCDTLHTQTPIAAVVVDLIFGRAQSDQIGEYRLRFSVCILLLQLLQYGVRLFFLQLLQYGICGHVEMATTKK